MSDNFTPTHKRRTHDAMKFAGKDMEMQVNLAYGTKAEEEVAQKGFKPADASRIMAFAQELDRLNQGLDDLDEDIASRYEGQEDTLTQQGRQALTLLQVARRQMREAKLGLVKAAGEAHAASSTYPKKSTKVPRKKVIDQLRKLGFSYGVVVLADGSTTMVDGGSASAIVKVYDALGPEHQAKADRMLSTQAGLLKFADFAWTKVKL